MIEERQTNKTATATKRKMMMMAQAGALQVTISDRKKEGKTKEGRKTERWRRRNKKRE
jgi:hypothetical protein